MQKLSRLETLTLCILGHLGPQTQKELCELLDASDTSVRRTIRTLSALDLTTVSHSGNGYATYALRSPNKRANRQPKVQGEHQPEVKGEPGNGQPIDFTGRPAQTQAEAQPEAQPEAQGEPPAQSSGCTTGLNTAHGVIPCEKPENRDDPLATSTQGIPKGSVSGSRVYYNNTNSNTSPGKEVDSNTHYACAREKDPNWVSFEDLCEAHGVTEQDFQDLIEPGKNTPGRELLKGLIAEKRGPYRPPAWAREGEQTYDRMDVPDNFFRGWYLGPLNPKYPNVNFMSEVYPEEPKFQKQYARCNPHKTPFEQEILRKQLERDLKIAQENPEDFMGHARKYGER